MNITPSYFFFVHRNIKDFINKGSPEDLDKVSHFLIYDRQKPDVKERYKMIWNDWENGFFTVQEFKIYLLYNYLFKKSIFVTSIKAKKIKETFELFSDVQWNIDKQIIESICKNINIKNIKEFLSLKLEDGKNRVEKLIEEQKISPIIWIKYVDKLNDNQMTTKNKLVITKIKQLITNDN